MSGTIDAHTLKGWLSDGAEIALFDVREPGQFAEGHLFFAVPLPYSRLELELERLAPRPDVRVAFCDAGDGVAERASRRAEALGYTDVHVLAGGTPGWKAAGYTLFDGVNVPSKTFGELIEHARHTPRIKADDLIAMRDRGEDHIIVDGRTWAEYTRFNIPGGVSCPNGELALRIGRLAPDARTTVVVNCAGRTRSIIGAQTLIDLGIANRVVALENGTQGWFLAGLELERGAMRRPPPVPEAGAVAELQAKASRHAERHGVVSVGAPEVVRWLADRSRTTFVLDVRTVEELAGADLPVLTHAPGGQLVQATDQWVGVKGARVVLVDGEMVRAPMTAAWLRQLGHEAFVLAGGAQAWANEVAKANLKASPSRADEMLPEIDFVSASDIETMMQSGDVLLIDLRSSAAYRAGHIPGSVWSVRPRIAAAGGPREVVLITDEPLQARAAALDLAESGVRRVMLLDGGVSAWQANGGSIEASPGQPADAERIDFVFHTHRRHDGDAEAARAYLAWETGLIERLDAQERGSFRIEAGPAR